MQTQIKILSDRNLQRIHDRSLHLLAQTGIQVDTEKGRAILEQAGAIPHQGSLTVQAEGVVVVVNRK